MKDSKTNVPTVAVPDEGATVRLAPERPAGAPAGGELQLPELAGIMPIRNAVIFPGTVMPLAVGRQKSRRLLNEMLPEQKIIVAVAQRDEQMEDPDPAQLYEVGTAILVLKLLKMEDGNQNVIVHGLVRVRINRYEQTEPYLRAHVVPLPDEAKESTELEALAMNVRQSAARIIQLAPNIPEEAQVVLNNIESPGALADFLASNLSIDTPDKQELLETLDVPQRLRSVGQHLQHQLEVLELSSHIQEQVRRNIDRTQRDYYLQEQLKAIQKELGQSDERTAEIEELRAKIAEAKMPDRVRPEAQRELDRLSKLPQASPEYTVIRTYLDWMLEIPWGTVTEDRLDIARAEEILNEDHHDLEKVKKRILEYLAVRKLAPGSRGPILCFMGPPGVGKTSLGQSIARALERKFIRMSLGGLRDEAELRGHRRTYIGAMPGRIVQEIRKAGTMNPVFMLDEIDKVGQDFRGDPTSALLEVLDPAQNDTFNDNYLNVPLDLSKVMFIATGNYMGGIPGPLRDRMEIIELPGYTSEDKLAIAAAYLVPRQRRENGLKAGQLKLPATTLRAIIDGYTREAGVRDLERNIGAVARAAAARVARGGEPPRTVKPAELGEYLGPRRFESEVAQRTSVPGVATGMAYTPGGGEIIFVEATRFPGRGGLMLTGQIGDVMRESAQAAFSYVRSQADRFGINGETLAKSDVHIHVPAGAIPKDGPSAGVAMAAALLSLLTDRAIHHDVAMTGEITLRGLVLPVGGIKQKVLAARAAGIRTVILPERNRMDLEEIPSEARKDLRFVFAERIDDVLQAAMDGKPARQGDEPPKRRARKKSAKRTARSAKA